MEHRGEGSGDGTPAARLSRGGQAGHAPAQRSLAAGALGGLAALPVVALLLAGAGPAVLLAALLAPVVMAGIVRRASTQRGRPAATVLLCMLAGGVVGAALASLARLYLSRLAPPQFAVMSQGIPPVSLTLLLGVSLPLLGELLKLVGPLLLRGRPGRAADVRDGLVLGMASGVGFAAASTVVNYWPIVQDGYTPAGAAGLAEWTLTLLGLGVLRPLVHGAATGLIGAGIWAAMRQRGAVILPVVAGLSGSVAYSLGELVLLGQGTLAVLALHTLVAGLLLAAVRRTVRAPLMRDSPARAPGQSP